MKAKIGGFMHLAIGEEATIVGTVAAMRDEDYLLSTYREHGQVIARGTDPNVVMAELFGREGGTSRGRGGSMHLFDPERRFLGGYGIVGGNLPLAAGVALASDYKGEDSVTVCMFGDGASNQGTFGETMNIAALWKLPIVFVVVNNQYGMGTAIHRHSAVTDLSQKASCLGVPGERVDGMDVLAVREVMAEHLRRAREEREPTLVEALTYRFRGHSAADPEVYRSKEEVAQWRERDPILSYMKLLEKEGVLTEEEFQEHDRGRDRDRRPGGRVGRRQPGAGARVAVRQRVRAGRPGPGLVLGGRAHARGRTAGRTSPRSASTASPTSWPRRAPRTRAPATCRDAAAPRKIPKTRSRANNGRDALPRGAERGHAGGDASGRVGVPDGRGRGRLPGRLQGQRGDARGVRGEARARHADLGEHDRRDGGRRGDGRAAPDRRDHDRQLRAAGDGPDHQLGRAHPLHVRRPGAGAADRALPAGRGPPARAHALPHDGGDVPARPRSAGCRTVHSRGREGPAEGRDPGRQPCDLHRAREPLRHARRGARQRRARCASARRRSAGRART